MWDEFDSLPTPLVSKQAKPSPAIQSDVSSGRTQSSSTNRSPQPQSKPKAKSHDPFDFDSFEDPGDSQGSALGGGDFEEDDDFLGFGNSGASKPVTSETRKASIGEDDILGALGAPAPPSRKTNPSLTPGGSSSCSRVPSPADGSRAQLQSRRIGPSSSNKRPTSPPPHIVGQLVEMGFGPVEARKALAQTDSGVDVQAAAEILVGNQGSSRSRNADTGRRRKDVDGEEGSEGSAEERDRQLAWEIQREEEENMKKARRFGTGTKGGDASSNQAQPRRKPNVPPREDREREREDGDGTSTPDWQKQADQLYNQAQEISSSVFNKANAFWSSAKAQAQKALEERSAAQQAGEGSGRSSPATGSEKARNRRWGTSSNNRSDRTKEWEGKPRWMVEAEEAEANEGGAKVADNGKQAEVKSGEFKDSDDEQEQAKSQTSHATGKRPQERRPQREPASEARTNPDKDLWDLPPDSGSSKSKNPFDSSAGKQSSRSTPPPSRSTNPPKADPKVSRNLIPEDQDSSASFIPRVSQLKLSGNESFKKGSYGEAEAFYSKALENLPEKSLRRIPILNNRGNSRLKNGDSRNTIKDSNEVILLILPNGDLNSRVLAYNPNSDIGLPVHLTNEINLRDSWAKALSKKAQAEEALEKWVSARSSWENLQRFEKEFGSGKLGLQNMRASKDGIGRCEKMMSKGGGSKEPSSTAASSSRGNSSSNTAKSAAAARASRSAAEAVKRAEAAGRERVRAENAAADAEDAAKFALKDQVDGRIDDWKKGKENNIRALIASLDGLTWSELGWKKIGMHELITDAQVKKGYVRAIAKLHPDKVSENVWRRFGKGCETRFALISLRLIAVSPFFSFPLYSSLPRTQRWNRE